MRIARTCLLLCEDKKKHFVPEPLQSGATNSWNTRGLVHCQIDKTRKIKKWETNLYIKNLTKTNLNSYIVFCKHSRFNQLMNTVDREETFSLFAKAFGDRNSESMFCNNLQNTTKSVQTLKTINVKCIFIQVAIKFQLK